MADAQRSNRAEVRNPVLAMPSMVRIRALEPAARDALCMILAEMQTEARAKAELCWRTHKAPMAAYWKAVSVYAGHMRKAIRRHNIDAGVDHG